MFNDKSGQLMLISAFLLAIAVVTISLMLNNVIYASNLAYVGFMDQSRYDDICFKQVTAREMNYAYAQHHGTQAYTDYLTDYKDTINRITSTKGRYIEFDTCSITDPHPLTDSHNDQHMLSIYGKSSSASYAISTGTDMPVIPPTYDIVLQQPNPMSIQNNGIEQATLTVDVTDKITLAGVSGVKVKFWYDRIDGKITDSSGDTQPVDGWPTDSNGKVIVYYTADNGALSGIVNIYAYTDSAQSGSQGLSITSLTPPAIIIDLAPHTPPAQLSVISEYANTVMLTVTVTDSNNYPLSSVIVQFNTDRSGASVTDDHGNSDMVTGPSGTLTVYYHDTDQNPGIGHVWVTDTSGSFSSNVVSISCQPKVVCDHDPTIDSTASFPTTHSGNIYTINIPVEFTLQAQEDIQVNTIEVIPAGVITIVNPQPYFTRATDLLTVTTLITSNPTFTIKLGVTCTGYCTTHNVDYCKDGTLTITGDKNAVKATLSFP